jgi:hypothetical protein
MLCKMFGKLLVVDKKIIKYGRKVISTTGHV